MNVFKNITWQQLLLKKYYILILTCITIVLMLPLLLHLAGAIPDLTIVNIPLHTSLEAAGSVILLVITVLLFMRYHADSNELDYPFIAMGFLGMAVFDLFHSTNSVGNIFIFSHAVSMLTGGFWFGVIALPRSLKMKIRTNTWFAATVLLWIFAIAWMVILPESLPEMQNGERFSFIAGILNLVSMAGFSVGFIALLRRFRSDRETEVFYVAVVILIHVISRITFNLSEVWNMEWWLWHIYRFLGATILFTIVINVFKLTLRGYEQLHQEQELIIDEIERKNAELSQYAFVTSHDLQEPLRKIRNYSELLEKSHNDQLGEKGNKYIRSIVSGSIRMQELIENLMSLASITERPLQLQRIDTRVLVKKVLLSGKLDQEIENASLSFGTIPSFTADRDQMQKLFFHLLSNALKFRSGQKLQINIYGEELAEYWQFSVRDNGIGFEEKYQDKIFRVFERLNRGDRYPGTGIGLALCKRIVERHGGEIKAISQPGAGAEFIFTIKKRIHHKQQTQ